MRRGDGFRTFPLVLSALSGAVVVTAHPAVARADLLAVDSFAADPNQVSPANEDGLADETMATFELSTACADLLVPTGGGPGGLLALGLSLRDCATLVLLVLRSSDLEARWLVDIVPAADPSGVAVRTFDGVEPLAAGPGPLGLVALFALHPVTFAWDGRDESGALVSDGAYLLSLSADLVAIRRSNGVETTRATTGPVSVPVEVDNTALAVAITSPLDGATLGSSTVVVTGMASGGDVSSVTVEGQPAILLADGTFTATVVLPEGSATIAAIALDDAGNVSFATVDVTIDLTPPEIVFEPEADGLVTRLDPVPLSGRIGDRTPVSLAVGGVAASTLGANSDTLRSVPFTVAVPLGPGANVVAVSAVDAAGHVTAFPISVTLDTTPPAIVSIELDGTVLPPDPAEPPRIQSSRSCA